VQQLHPAPRTGCNQRADGYRANMVPFLDQSAAQIAEVCAPLSSASAALCDGPGAGQGRQRKLAEPRINELAPRKPGIERIPQAVPNQVEGDDSYSDGSKGRVDLPPVTVR
jgi:hypothetical protein